MIGGVGWASTHTEFVTKNGSSIGPDIPPSWGACATRINATHGILIGVDTTIAKETLFVNLETFQMETGPEVSILRYHSACSRFSHVNGSEYIIVAGGNSASGKTTEILNVSDNSATWITGIMISFKRQTLKLKMSEPLTNLICRSLWLRYTNYCLLLGHLYPMF